ncbi:MAG TPA: asparagine synthase C-terminal domain-containing protein, partial [Chryseosolibacter sp.]|nr:asparagine synthase C-terminal domain-containing protein [Chryseosolibacter sp.]
DVLQYTDEPFADSSAINVYILSKETRKHATVALSGDGADELLGGYNKHEAFYRMLNPGWQETAIALAGPLWKRLPRSRNNSLANGVRQALRFAEGFKLTPADRYWRWATFTDLDEARSLLAPVVIGRFVVDTFEQRKQEMLTNIYSGNSMDNILRTDIELVLANDMLVKVDLMSMANGLEVRSPFLDYEVVEFACSLPDDFKITKGRRKRILQDAFRDMLPARLYNRPKKGFEVPMLGWLRHELRERIEDDLLSKRHIEEQGLFNYHEVDRLKKKLFSNNPGDVPARIWGLVVFQSWFKKYLN